MTIPEGCRKLSAVIRESGDIVQIADAERIGNGAVFKRLGYLAEQSSGNSALVDLCQQRLTKGNAILDSALMCRRLVTRWRLFIPDSRPSTRAS